jgi:hypothetical protein
VAERITQRQDPAGAAEITCESLLSAKARTRATLDTAP